MKPISRLKRIHNSMPILSWLLPLVLLSQLISPSLIEPAIKFSLENYLFTFVINNDSIVFTPDGKIVFLGSGLISHKVQQFIFSVGIVFIVIALLAICYILRFHLVRRKVHIVLSLLFTILISIWFFKYISAPSIVSLSSIVAGYKILRIENIDYKQPI